VGCAVGCGVSSEPAHPLAFHMDFSLQCASLSPQYPHCERH
jgi:hypothetical protein